MTSQAVKFLDGFRVSWIPGMILKACHQYVLKDFESKAWSFVESFGRNIYDESNDSLFKNRILLFVSR